MIICYDYLVYTSTKLKQVVTYSMKTLLNNMPFLYLLSRIVKLPRALSCQYEKNVFQKELKIWRVMDQEKKQQLGSEAALPHKLPRISLRSRSQVAERKKKVQTLHWRNEYTKTSSFSRKPVSNIDRSKTRIFWIILEKLVSQRFW